MVIRNANNEDEDDSDHGKVRVVIISLWHSTTDTILIVHHDNRLWYNNITTYK